MTKKNNKKSKNKKIDKNKIVKLVIPLIVAVLIIYAIYKVINLIIVPTNVLMIENGTIYNEEDAIRICYKR